MFFLFFFCSFQMQVIKTFTAFWSSGTCRSFFFPPSVFSMCINDTVVKSTAVSALNNARLHWTELSPHLHVREDCGSAGFGHCDGLQLSQGQLRTAAFSRFLLDGSQRVSYCANPVGLPVLSCFISTIWATIRPDLRQVWTRVGAVGGQIGSKNAFRSFGFARNRFTPSVTPTIVHPYSEITENTGRGARLCLSKCSSREGRRREGERERERSVQNAAPLRSNRNTTPGHA